MCGSSGSSVDSIARACWVGSAVCLWPSILLFLVPCPQRRSRCSTCGVYLYVLCSVFSMMQCFPDLDLLRSTPKYFNNKAGVWLYMLKMSQEKFRCKCQHQTSVVSTHAGVHVTMTLYSRPQECCVHRMRKSCRRQAHLLSSGLPRAPVVVRSFLFPRWLGSRLALRSSCSDVLGAGVGRVFQRSALQRRAVCLGSLPPFLLVRAV